MSYLSDQALDRLSAVANWPEFVSDRYSVTREVGRGGMGTVYLATDHELGREVALKVSNTVASAEFERRLTLEARALAELEHPGIVPVHDIGRLADGRGFYVMKRVNGVTLREHLARETNLAGRLRIFERICEAVAFAHSRRIIHRDLKPENVMVGEFGEVMVMDWGLSTSLASASSEGAAVMGTEGFMAPEQARGDVAAIDERADVYALGAILVTLLDNTQAPVPRPLRSICTRAMAPAPADRYASASELGADVARSRAGRAVLAHRETVVERVARLARVYQAPILLVVAYMILRALIALAVRR